MYWEGRSLIDGLAQAIDLDDDGYRWDAINCATVLEFMGAVEPTAGNCFCNDRSAVNATCGFRAILNFLADEVRRLAPTMKARKRTVEVGHG